MNKNLSTHLERYLRFCGVSDKKISECSMDTRMLHDLGFYGDLAEICIEVLRDDFDVNIDFFRFEDYFPSEYYEGNVFFLFFFWMFPFFRNYFDNFDKYNPLTLAMVDRAIISKVL